MSMRRTSIEKERQSMTNFELYDELNPDVWEAFKKFSDEAKNEKGFLHYSAKGIFEIIRWHTTVRALGKYKLNNNHAPDYARKMMKEFPEYKGFFFVRKLKTER